MIRHRAKVVGDFVELWTDQPGRAPEKIATIRRDFIHYWVGHIQSWTIPPSLESLSTRRN